MADMKFILSSKYGEFREEGKHTGIDIAMPEGTELKSVAEGVVVQVYDGSQAIGKGVKVQLENGQEAIYGHMEKVTVKVGEILDKGETIGFSGNTGNVMGENGGYHLHFGLKENGQFIDPTHFYKTIAEMSEAPKGFGGMAMDKFNDFSDWAIGKEVEWILKPIGNLLKDAAIALCDFLTLAMPDIGFVITLLTGVAIMITGRAVKPLLWGTSGLTVAIIWLANAYS